MRVARAMLVLTVTLTAAVGEPLAYVGNGGDIGGSDGWKTLCGEANRAWSDLTPALVAGELPLAGVRILVIGSYAYDGPQGKILSTLRARRGELASWLRAGGVLLELAQQDGGYARTDWLPEGLLVGRADPDYPTITWTRADHPLTTTPHALDASVLAGWKLRNWSIAWEALTSWDGFENLAACGNRGECSALVEAAVGRGRVLVSVISPDSMVRQGEGDTPAKARLYFANLLHYLDECAAGRGVALRPTPALGAVKPVAGALRLAFWGAGDSALLPLLAAAGVRSPRLVSGGPAPRSADLLLIDADAASAPTAAQSASVQAYLKAGGVVVELYQNRPQRPGWLPAPEQANRGGFPADFVVPEAAAHPLFEAPNLLTGSRRAAWREGPQPIAQPPVAAILGWGVVARFGGQTSPAAVLERSVGRGRAILVAADPRGATPGLARDNAVAFLANLLTYARSAAQGKVPLAKPATLPDRRLMWTGRQIDGSVMVPTNQLIRPAGRHVEFPGRPTDLALLPDGQTLLIVDRGSLRVLDLASGELRQEVASDGGHGFVGVAVTPDGQTVYTSSVKHLVQVWRRGADGKFTRQAPLNLPGDRPAPAGLALSADGATVYVAASRLNAVLALPTNGQGEPRRIDVGVAPVDVLRVGSRLYVTCWGGRRVKEGDRSANSSGTPVRVDQRTIANDGSVSVIDLPTWQPVAEVPVGLLPTGLCADAAGQRVYIANANSDSVSVIDTASQTVSATIPVKADARLPFGSGTNDVCLSPDGATLYVACGTLNAVAVVPLRPTPSVAGLLPVGWYPGAVVAHPNGRELYVANTKGVGSLAQATSHNSHHHQGSVSLLPVPTPAELRTWTAQTAANNRLTLALAGLEPPRPGVAPRPLPARHGEPSLLQHVVYIIRENRTYDQVLGDLPQGNGDPSLVHFGREVTPNSHALAERFGLLDNFYCSGILSADGHQWACEGYVTAYLEKSFGGFVRSYPYEGDDALAYSPGGFLWDNVLAHGGSFRCYGEMVQAHIKALDPKLPATFRNTYDDFVDDGVMQRFEIRATSLIAAVQANLCPTAIGFPSNVPDIYRAGEFIKELRGFEQAGKMPSLCMILLPNDHTSGTTPGMPTPRAAVADNDLALGQIVEALTKSRFWPQTAIFVCQDDPQAGADHVDGHRSPAYVISPYSRRGTVDSANYTQVGMIKTMELILGLPPMNQLDLAAEPMATCFGSEPDLTPYTCLPNAVPLDELNPPRSALSGPALFWCDASLAQDFDEVDEADEDTLNRVLWHTCKGYDTPYPTWAAGAR
ncbi:MAG: bifunctional YncE family protein/alkaline phosphatase family protein [Fimbriimonadaceae bacterium]|nr:bifunctional YncE family protein/alkaline phosphatase family protein [Fimbriimonadaceae bacterium]